MRGGRKRVVPVESLSAAPKKCFLPVGTHKMVPSYLVGELCTKCG
jgi:hypothetical protein